MGVDSIVDSQSLKYKGGVAGIANCHRVQHNVVWLVLLTDSESSIKKVWLVLLTVIESSINRMWLVLLTVIESSIKGCGWYC